MHTEHDYSPHCTLRNTKEMTKRGKRGGGGEREKKGGREKRKTMCICINVRTSINKCVGDRETHGESATRGMSLEKNPGHPLRNVIVRARD